MFQLELTWDQPTMNPATPSQRVLHVALRPIQGVIRSAVDVVVLLDCSTSMSRDGRLTAAAAACRAVRGTLTPADRLYVVGFHSKVVRSRKIALDTDAGDAELEEFLGSLQAAGGTRTDLALLHCAQRYQRSQGVVGEPSAIPARHGVLMLITDGLPTDQDGVDLSPSHWGPLFEQAKQLKNLGMPTTAIGIGDVANSEFLARLARAGDGEHLVVARPSDLSSSLVEQVLRARSRVPFDVQLSVARLAAGVTLTSVEGWHQAGMTGPPSQATLVRPEGTTGPPSQATLARPEGPAGEQRRANQPVWAEGQWHLEPKTIVGGDRGAGAEMQLTFDMHPTMIRTGDVDVLAVTAKWQRIGSGESTGKCREVASLRFTALSPRDNVLDASRHHPQPTQEAQQTLESPGWCLVVRRGRQPGTRYPLSSDLVFGTMVGATMSPDVHLGNQLPPGELSHLSPRHFRVRVVPEGVLLNDLESEFGTYVNAAKLASGQEATLNVGDTVEAGGVVMEVVKVEMAD